MPAMTTVICGGCKQSFEARSADVARGWGKFCNKSCKATAQTKRTGISGPDYRASGKTAHQMASGNYAKSQFSGRRHPSTGRKGYLTSVDYNEWDDEVINGDVVWSNKYNSWVDFESNGDHPFDSEAAGFNNT